MDRNNLIIDEQLLTPESIYQMKEHAKLYDSTPDKKTFLKNISAYEQKVVLLNSVRPYEVLQFLSELELETSKLILNSLNYDDISRILMLFTQEDKEMFYKTFSDLDLVNQFIVHDKKADEYVSDLSTERKVDLLQASNKETIEATSKVYESIPQSERVEVMDKITSAEASVVLDQVEITEENVKLEENEQNEILNKEEKTEENKEQSEEQQERIKEDKKENTALRDFLTSKLEYYKQNVPGFENIDINNPELYESLPLELQQLIDRDFEMLNKDENKEQLDQTELTNELSSSLGDDDITQIDSSNLESESKENELFVVDNGSLEKFTQAKETCEKELIVSVQNALASQNLQNTNQKTL